MGYIEKEIARAGQMSSQYYIGWVRVWVNLASWGGRDKEALC